MVRLCDPAWCCSRPAFRIDDGAPSHIVVNVTATLINGATFSSIGIFDHSY